MAEDPADHPPADSSPPSFDALSLEFPTDRLTVRNLIERFPQEFVWEADPARRGSPPNFDPFDTNQKAFFSLRMAMNLERELAQLAFLAKSDPDFQPGVPRNDLVALDGEATRGEIIEWLDEHYRELGLTTGKNQTVELVRRIESQAAQQAGSDRSP